VPARLFVEGVVEEALEDGVDVAEVVLIAKDLVADAEMTRVYNRHWRSINF